ncbi:hypothetical protein B484DRAFT_240106 [Ochromonadaceae sp. CCMP2298]|nr:hypothetical protein B484DRAFT_240106 [Ochromonadaceae sp. CCMP2298]
MDRIRLETAILISEKPADDLDEEVICELEKFGMPRDEVVRLVLTKTHSSLATLYYLLLDTIVNRRKARRTSGVVTGAVSRAKYVPAAKGGGGGQGGQMTQHDVAKREANAAATAQHRVAEQMAYQLQQQYTQQQQQQQAQQAQQQLDRQEYRLRPKSAAQTRSSSTGAQRPLSAYAGRR